MKTVFINCSPKKRFCASAWFLSLLRLFVTGEKVTELYVTDNATGEKSDNYAGEGLADGEAVEIKGTKKADYVVTLSFKTESGYEGVFGTLHFEDVPISLMAADAASGATPIAFRAPEAK